MGRSTSSPPRLRLTGIRKHFGATKALDGVDLTIAAGEAHAIIGENGAGKSTLMKALSGAHQPDSGEIQLDGERVVLPEPKAAQQRGIAMIYQELNLAPDLSVAENITLGREPGRGGWIERRRQREMARAALERLQQSDIPLDVPVGELPLAQQQMVEIARAVQEPGAGQAKLRLLILDEPTSSLTQVDARNLFGVIKRLQQADVSILYISHFLEECQEVAERFTVLRDGRSVGSGRMDEVSMDEIIRLMVGRDVSELYPRFDHKPGSTLLKVEELSGSPRPRRVSFELRRGEILGLAGLIGAGRTETARALFGLDPAEEGKVWIQGNLRPIRRPQLSWKEEAMGMVAEDRKNEGLLLNRSLADNLALTCYPRYRGRFGLLDLRGLGKATTDWIHRLEVRSRGPQQAVGELSGGNQQKIAFARLLHHQCEILLLDEPTRGIDIGSKATLYRFIGQLAAEGKSVLLISSYLPELLGLCDTIGVFSRGSLVAIKPRAQWDENSLLAAAIGQSEPPPQSTP